MARPFLLMALCVGALAAMLGSGMSPVPMVGQAAHTRAIKVDRDGSDSSDEDAELVQAPPGAVVLDRNPNGHFYADVAINGARVHALVDTGASGIALSRDDARAAGVGTSIGMPNIVGMGADGEVRGEVVTLDRVALGKAEVAAVPAIVLNSGEQSLLGQSFLSHFDSVEIKGDQMVLE